MKVKSILLSFILFISLRLVTEQHDNFFHNSEFYYSIDSFVGSDYFPQREEKIFTYFDNHFLKIGWIFNPSKHLQI